MYHNVDERSVPKDLRRLTELSLDGFPGMTLGDLIRIVDELLPVAESLLADRDVPAGDDSLLDVMCQALCNAVVLGGRTSSLQRLEMLQTSLQGFDRLLENVQTNEELPNEMRQLAREYKGHSESRLRLVSSQIARIKVMLAEEIEPFHSEREQLVDAPVADVPTCGPRNLPR